MKRWLVSMLVAGSMISLAPGTASAAKTAPAGGCPDSYDLLTIKEAVKVTGNTAAAIQEINKNGDNYVCVVEIPTPPPNHNVIDNNAPL
jgi:hypothetical protein